MLTEQLAELDVKPARLQLPLGLKVAVPVGIVAPEEEVSVTVVEHVKVTPTVAELGHATLVTVGCGVRQAVSACNSQWGVLSPPSQ